MTGKTKASGRAVSFAEEKNKTWTYEDEYADVSIEEIWFTGDDYTRSKATSREEARQWRRSGYGVLLKETFEPSFSKAQEYLNAFCQMEGDFCRRGVERHLSRQHAEERSDRKDNARQAVLIHQGKLRRKGVKPDEFFERIAVIYKDQCRAAHLFARRMGIADEYVVKAGEDNAAAGKLAGVEIPEGCHLQHVRAERRLSNMSLMSSNSMDSRRQWGHKVGHHHHHKGKHCPDSPATPHEEYYAAIA